MTNARLASVVFVFAALVGGSACKDPAPPPVAAVTSAATPSATSSSSASRPVVRTVPAGTSDSPRLALGAQGAVASQEAHASNVGVAILKKGGNAVDAAIAVAFALAVTHPSAGNIGGGGFMVVRMADGRARTIDYRETAPQRATRDMYLGTDGEVTRDALLGAKAAGIPGSVAGMALAHKLFGKLAWAELVLPAVGLARGHVIDRHHAADLKRAVARMTKEGFTESAKSFSKPDGSAWKVGDTFSQPALADTLTAIAKQGAAGFYRGDVANKMIAEITEHGGIWQLDDLSAYRAVERDPIRFSYRGYEVLTMPPPSGGGVVLRHILGAAELLELHNKPWPDPLASHLYVEAARRAYADRNALLGDPDQQKLPVAELLEDRYLAARVMTIDPAKATPSAEIGPGIEPSKPASEETTHFSVIDAAGNAVSNTTTLNTGFGSKLILTSVGVLLNNEMDDFSAKPGTANVYGLVQSEPNAIAPGKRMLSSMTPTIVSRDGEPRLIVGSPGGPTITTTVAQIIRHVLDHGMTIDQAVAAPRLHHQWLPDQIYVEAAVPQPLRDALRSKGHTIVERPPIGHANCIEVDPVSHGFRAAADTVRDGGKASAY